MNKTRDLENSRDTNKRGVSFKKITSKNDMKLRFMKLMRKSQHMNNSSHQENAQMRFKEPKGESQLGKMSTQKQEGKSKKKKQIDKENERKVINQEERSRSRGDEKKKLKVFCSFESEEMEDSMNPLKNEMIQQEIENIVFNRKESLKLADLEKKEKEGIADLPDMPKYVVFKTYSSATRQRNNKNNERQQKSKRLVQSIHLKNSSVSKKREGKGNIQKQKRKGFSQTQKRREQKSPSETEQKKNLKRNTMGADIIKRNIEGLAKFKEKKERRMRESIKIRESNDKNRNNSCNNNSKIHKKRQSSRIVGQESSIHKELNQENIEHSVQKQRDPAQITRGYNTSERLYKLSRERTREMNQKVRQMRKSNLIREMEACTFTPSINPLSLKFVQKRRVQSQSRLPKADTEEILLDNLKTDRKTPRKLKVKGQFSSGKIEVFLRRRVNRKSKQPSKTNTSEKKMKILKTIGLFGKSTQVRSPSKSFKNSKFYKKVINLPQSEGVIYKNVKQLLEKQLQKKVLAKKRENSKIVESTPKKENGSKLIHKNPVESFTLTERMSEILGFQPTVLQNSLFISQLKERFHLTRESQGVSERKKHVEKEGDTPDQRSKLVMKCPKSSESIRPSIGSGSHNTTLRKNCENHKSIIDAYITRLQSCQNS